MKRRLSSFLWPIPVIPMTVFLARGLHAQVYPLYPEDTVRVRAPHFIGGRLQGTLAGVKHDSLAIYGNHRKILIPIQKIASLQVARGETRDTKKGLFAGAIAGGLVFGFAGAAAASGQQDEGSFFVLSPGQVFLSALVGGAVLGGLTGAIIGSGHKSRHWVEVPLDRLMIQKRETALARKPGIQNKSTVHQKIPGAQRWRFSFAFGTTSRGPAKAIEQAMQRDGWNEKMPVYAFTFEPVSGPVSWQAHPYSKTGFGKIGAPWTLQLSYKMNQRFETTFLISHAPMGATYGYRSVPETHLTLDYYITTFSPMLVLKPADALQFGLGPALVISKIEQKSGGTAVYLEQKSLPGAIIQATSRYPQRTRFFIELSLQYRWTSKSTYGPFKTSYHAQSLSQLNAFEANFSHLFMGFGIGLRL